MNIATPTLVEASHAPEVYGQMLSERRLGERAMVATMTFDTHNAVSEAFKAKSIQGDLLAVDFIGTRYGHGPSFKDSDEQIRHQQQLAEYIEAFKGEFVELNRPRLPKIGGPFRTMPGRSHIKSFSVGERFLSLGGVNCDSGSFEHHDAILAFESKNYQNFIERFIENKAKMTNDKDKYGEEFEFDAADRSQVLVDYGVFGRSVILDRILADLTNQNIVDVKLTSNYIPAGKVDKTLAYHQSNGSNVDVVANETAKFFKPGHSAAEGVVQTILQRFSKTLWYDPNPDEVNHFKSAQITNTNGETVTYIGSSNFHSVPVIAGTAEVALRSMDEDINRQVAEYNERTFGLVA